MDRHCSDERLLAWLYGVERDDPHRSECGKCRDRGENLRRRRALMLAVEPAVSEEFLAAQRRAIHARIDQERAHPSPAVLMPWVVAALVLLLALGWLRTETRSPTGAEISEVKAFEDAFAMVASSYPEAVEPLKSLFEVSR